MNFNPVSEADSNAVATIDDLIDFNREILHVVSNLFITSENALKFRNMIPDEQLVLVR